MQLGISIKDKKTNSSPCKLFVCVSHVKIAHHYIEMLLSVVHVNKEIQYSVRFAQLYILLL